MRSLLAIVIIVSALTGLFTALAKKLGHPADPDYVTVVLVSVLIGFIFGKWFSGNSQ